MCANTAIPLCADPVILYGSPRDDGVCAHWLNVLLRTAPKALVYHCFKGSPSPCDDCRACRTSPRCRLHDLDAVYDAVEACERLIFLTPVFNRSFPAPLKAVIDRFQCYYSSRFFRGIHPAIEKPRQAALLTVCGSEREDGRYLEYQLSPLLTVLHATWASAVHIRDADTDRPLFSSLPDLEQIFPQKTSAE